MKSQYRVSGQSEHFSRWMRVILCLALLFISRSTLSQPESVEAYYSMDNWTYAYGGIIRGDTSEKKMSLIFTGGEYGEGAEHILDVLKELDIQSGFFVTGDYLKNESHFPGLHRMVQEGHYLGPHSDSHPLYCPWEDREKTLVTREFFAEDLLKNIEDLREFGAMPPGQPIFFIPPYEWYNEDQSRWSREMDIILFNFTPGSGSNRDWAPEGHRSFVPSEVIVEDILKYEQKDPHGMNGFILLLHVGSQREDKMHPHVKPLLEALLARGYQFVRIDELLKP